MIAIINYGLGNVQALYNVYKRLDIPAKIVNTKSELINASHLILPGVGSFDHAMELLEKSQMAETLTEQVLTHKKPILGICIGMQMLATSSEEGKKKKDLAGLKAL
jgi:imidazole glycerol-phosphate synthase subunit HisH